MMTEITFVNATLDWDPPDDLGGRTEISYDITYNGIVISDIVSTRYTLTDLLPDTEYTVSVAAINDVSDQDPSPAASTITTIFTTLPVPSGEQFFLLRAHYQICSLHLLANGSTTRARSRETP